VRKELLGVALDHVAVELSTSELSSFLLQGLLFGRQFEIHGRIWWREYN
jgi:hypothetical protein